MIFCVVLKVLEGVLLSAYLVVAANATLGVLVAFALLTWFIDFDQVNTEVIGDATLVSFNSGLSLEAWLVVGHATLVSFYCGLSLEARLVIEDGVVFSRKPPVVTHV